MNYLKLIISFWKLRQRQRITSIQADLFLFLVHQCNEQDWENPFECSNRSIILNTGISEDALSDARNRLVELGLIEFTAGLRNSLAPKYKIIGKKSIEKVGFETFIYLIHNKRNGYYKIGMSKNPKVRERTLQAEEPDLEIIYKCLCSSLMERKLHDMFKAKRLRGEWFRLSTEDVEQIKTVLECSQ